MSGDSMDWIREDQETFGEQVPRCNRVGCHSPLELYVRDTAVVERCQYGHHVQHFQLVYPEEFTTA